MGVVTIISISDKLSDTLLGYSDSASQTSLNHCVTVCLVSAPFSSSPLFFSFSFCLNIPPHPSLSDWLESVILSYDWKTSVHDNHPSEDVRRASCDHLTIIVQEEIGDCLMSPSDKR